MRQVLRRILAGVIVLVALSGLAAGLYAASTLQQSARELEEDIVGGMDYSLEALEVVSETLQVLISTVDDTSAVVDAAVSSSQDTQLTLQALQPAVLELGEIAGTDLPASVAAVQGAMPTLEQAGRTVDRTLRTLAAFEWSATIPLVNYRLGFDLGVEYDPAVPLDQSIAEVSEGLAKLPTQLEGIETGLVNTHQSLSETITSIGVVGEDLAAVGRDLAQTSRSLHAYNGLIDRATLQMRNTRWNIRQQIVRGRIIATVFLIWLSLSQIAPLYLGCAMLSGPLPVPPSTRPELGTEFGRAEHLTELYGEQVRPSAEGYSEISDGQ